MNQKITTDKLKNFILNNKKILLIASVLIIFAILIFLVWYFYQTASILEQKAEELRKEVEFYEALPTPDVPAVEIFQPGEIGEIEVDPAVPQSGAELGDIIFDTSGVVQEVHRDRVIVLGDGSNFEDRQPRQLTLLWTLETDLFLADGTRYVGLRGLEQLSPGMHIGITGNENIRGRTEFTARDVNIREF